MHTQSRMWFGYAFGASDIRSQHPGGATARETEGLRGNREGCGGKEGKSREAGGRRTRKSNAL
eukprot:3933766-Rhodomonas_salina.2